MNEHCIHGNRIAGMSRCQECEQGNTTIIRPLESEQQPNVAGQAPTANPVSDSPTATPTPDPAAPSEKLQPTPRHLYEYQQLVVQLPEGVDDDERVLAVIQRGNTLAKKLEDAERAAQSARAAIIEECAKVLGDRLESLRIMADRAGYTREGSDLAQQASATYDAIKTIRALASRSDREGK